MTQYYKMPGFTLARANLSTRVLVTLFLLTLLGGLGVALLQYHERAGGFTRRAAREWVEGNEGDLEATRIVAEKSFGELVAITHEHAFSLPMLLFVLLHLVALTGIGERWKIALYLLGFLSLVGSLGGPWLISHSGPAWTALLLGSGLVLAAVMGISALLCLFELWLAAPLRRRRRQPEPPPPDPLFPERRESAGQ